MSSKVHRPHSAALGCQGREFSIDADNQSFPPSISGIQNGIVAYAMNLRERETNYSKVELAATTNVTKESNIKWSAKYELKAKYRTSALLGVIDDGSYRLATSLDHFMVVAASASSCLLSSGAGALTFERDFATGLYRIPSSGKLLTESGSHAVLADPDGSVSRLWRVSPCSSGYTATSSSGLALGDRCASTAEGNRVWLYEPNSCAAQAWRLF